MEKEVYCIEGLDIEIEKRSDEDAGRRMTAYMFRAIREQTGMNRKDFAEWLGIPYRTMQEWELGRRVMPDYVLRLIAYKVANERSKSEQFKKDNATSDHDEESKESTTK
jgi:DNA-binding transcriptional regulator YiaG